MSSHGEASTIAEGSVSFALDPSDAAACLESIERASAPPDDSAKMAILEGTLPSPPTEVVERYEYAHVRSSSAAGYGCSGARRSAGVATVTPSIVEGAPPVPAGARRAGDEHAAARARAAPRARRGARRHNLRRGAQGSARGGREREGHGGVGVTASGGRALRGDGSAADGRPLPPLGGWMASTPRWAAGLIR